MTPTLHRFDRFDERRGILRVAGEITHTEELGGEDTIEFDCLETPSKGDRLLWWDADDGRWREHVVVRTEEPSRGPCSVYAESAMSEMLGDFIVEEQIVLKEPMEALERVLSHTRWQVGYCEPYGYERGCLLYHTNALAALRRLEELWERELVPRIEVTDGRVSARKLDFIGRRGAWRGARFTYGKNLRRCSRTVLESEVFTALYGYGKGLPILDEGGQPTGGYTRRISFGEINGGVDWVGDEEARQQYGLWNADRTEKVHRFGHIVVPGEEDKWELRSATYRALRACKQPQVSYELDAVMIEGSPNVQLGDEVVVLDTSREPEWRLKSRCLKRMRTYSKAATEVRVTVGTISYAYWIAAADVAARVASVEETAGIAADTVASYEDLGSKEF